MTICSAGDHSQTCKTLEVRAYDLKSNRNTALIGNIKKHLTHKSKKLLSSDRLLCMFVHFHGDLKDRVHKQSLLRHECSQNTERLGNTGLWSTEKGLAIWASVKLAVLLLVLSPHGPQNL